MRLFIPKRNKIPVSWLKNPQSSATVELDHGSTNLPLFPEVFGRVEIHEIHGRNSKHRAAKLYVVYKVWKPGLKILAIWGAEHMWWQIFAQKVDRILVWKRKFIASGILFLFWRQSVYICALNEKPALRISLTVAAEPYSSVIRNSALGNNYVIAIIRGSSSPS